MEKYKSYSTEEAQEQRIDLHKNFRSREQVLESVNFIFRQIMGEDLGGPFIPELLFRKESQRNL